MRSNSTLPVPQPSSAPPTPTRLTGANSDIEEEERGDLIQFYNNIYRKQIQTFAMKYSQANSQVSGSGPLEAASTLAGGTEVFHYKPDLQITLKKTKKVSNKYQGTNQLSFLCMFVTSYMKWE